MDVSNKNLKEQIGASNKDLFRKIEEIYLHTEIMNKELGETRDNMGEVRDEQKTLRKDLGELKEKNSYEHAEIKTDLKWLQKFQWIIISTSIASLLGIIIKIIFDR